MRRFSKSGLFLRLYIFGFMTISPLSTIIVVAFLLKLLRFPFPPPLAEAGGALPFTVGRGRAGVGSEEEEGGTVWLDDDYDD